MSKEDIAKVCKLLLVEREPHSDSYHRYIELTEIIKFLQDFAETQEFDSSADTKIYKEEER